MGQFNLSFECNVGTSFKAVNDKHVKLAGFSRLRRQNEDGKWEDVTDKAGARVVVEHNLMIPRGIFETLTQQYVEVKKEKVDPSSGEVTEKVFAIPRLSPGDLIKVECQYSTMGIEENGRYSIVPFMWVRKLTTLGKEFNNSFKKEAILTFEDHTSKSDSAVEAISRPRNEKGQFVKAE